MTFFVGIDIITSDVHNRSCVMGYVGLFMTLLMNTEKIFWIFYEYMKLSKPPIDDRIKRP